MFSSKTIKKIVAVASLAVIAVTSFAHPAFADSNVTAGPQDMAGTLAAKGTVTEYHTFIGGQRAAAGAVDAASGNIAMYVYDEAGNLVCQDAEFNGSPDCVWFPDTTQTYKIVIVNQERYSLNFEFLTN